MGIPQCLTSSVTAGNLRTLGNVHDNVGPKSDPYDLLSPLVEAAPVTPIAKIATPVAEPAT
jgi:hypothetical protein